MIVDIIISTRNRLAITRRMIECLVERTHTPYRLHVMDDASDDRTAEYLLGLDEQGRLASLTLRTESVSVPANWNQAAVTGTSPILVFTDDDILCPQLDPDWLSRGLHVMAEYPNIGMLSLHEPSGDRASVYKNKRVLGPVTVCHRVGGHLAFVRRAAMQRVVIPERFGELLYGIMLVPGYQTIDLLWSRGIQAQGYDVGFLTGVYCQHIGLISVRNGQDLSSRAIEQDPETLEPRWTS